MAADRRISRIMHSSLKELMVPNLAFIPNFTYENET